MDEKPKLKLIGGNGNAFLILGKAQQSARKAGWPQEKREQMMKEATSGDYNNLLCVVQKYFNVS